MKTLTNYREDISALQKQIAALDAKATLENRDPVPEELALKGELMDGIERISTIVASMERDARLNQMLESPTAPPATVPAVAALEGARVSDKEKFGSLGEQLVAVYRSDVHKVHDPRLLRNAAATGLSESVSSEGGYLVQGDFITDLLRDVFDTGELAQRCRRIQISGNSNRMTINGVDETSRASTRSGGILGYWLDEARTKTASKPAFRQIELNLRKLIGLCYSTDELLDDAMALESYIRTGFADEFGFQLDDSIVNGTGANKPLGILNSAGTVSVTAETGQTAATIVAENVEKMWSRMFARSLPSAEWFINQQCYPQLFQMSHAVGTGGIPVFMPPGGLSVAPYGTLFGRPITPIEQCAALGTVGDIIFADMRNGYILAEKGGIKADTSIHVSFTTDQTAFRFVMRVDGEPVRSTPLTPYKGGSGATQSHFITLETRS